MPNPFTGEKYWYEQDNQPMSTRENPTPSLPVNNPVANRNAVPQGSLQGTMTQPQKQGSLTDFAKVMRVISETAYKDRQKKEGKVLKGQFDPTKVSGSIFQQIMGAVEAKRGGDISKMYGSAVEAAKFDLQQKADQEAKAQELALAQQKIEEDKRQYNLTYYQTNGEFPPEVGSLDGFSGATQANGMPWRTDRNNNPIAAAVSLGGKNQFTQALDLAGIPWTYGDAFPDDPNMRTIKILGDPVEAARVILANTNAIDGWYSKAASGEVLRQTGIMTGQQFASLSQEDQNKIIIGIYKGEAGSGNLVKNLISTSTGKVNDILQTQAEAYKKDPTSLKNVPMAQRGRVQELAKSLPTMVSPEQKTVMMDNVSLVNSILENPESISGFFGGVTGAVPLTEGWKKRNEFNQLMGNLKLDKRQMLKGSGTISDFEFKILGEAASSINRWSSEEDFKKDLTKIRGVFMTAAGEKAQVKVSKGNQSKSGLLDRDQITDAIAQGYKVEYI